MKHTITIIMLALALAACDPTQPCADTSTGTTDTSTTDTTDTTTDTSTDAGECMSEIFTCVSAKGVPIVCDFCPAADLTVCTCFDAQTNVPVTCYAFDPEHCT